MAQEAGTAHTGAAPDPRDIADRRPRLVEPDFTTVNRTLGDRAAFYLQPSYVIHSNTYSTAGCLEHIEHGHDIPRCADLATGIESNRCSWD